MPTGTLSAHSNQNNKITLISAKFGENPSNFAENGRFFGRFPSLGASRAVGMSSASQKPTRGRPREPSQRLPDENNKIAQIPAKFVENPSNFAENGSFFGGFSNLGASGVVCKSSASRKSTRRRLQWFSDGEALLGPSQTKNTQIPAKFDENPSNFAENTSKKSKILVEKFWFI